METNNDPQDANVYAAPSSSSQVTKKKKKSINRLVELLVLLGVAGFLIAMFLPAVQQVRSTPHSTVCMNQCRQIALALINYESANGHFPPAYIADENGKPMHSWRVLILPYIEEQALYDSYSMDEPWDGPNNSKLHDEHVPYVLRCSANRNNEHFSDYALVTGEGTGFVADETINYSNLADGSSYTILLTEIAGSDFHWMKPQDITLDEFVESANIESSNCRKDGRNVALFDGSTHCIATDIPATELRKLVLIADGEEVNILDW